MSDCHFFFFNDTATTEIYTLSLHDALPISGLQSGDEEVFPTDCRGCDCDIVAGCAKGEWRDRDRKSTRLNSSHLVISYAVFCLKKKNIYNIFTFMYTSNSIIRYQAHFVILS